MTFPTIKGSPIHKEAKPVVSQSRTAADPSLIYAADQLGKSNIPGAIDYRINIKQPTFSDSKSKPRKDEAGPGSGTYKEYVYDHNADKRKMSDEDKAQFGDPLSRKDWRELNRQWTDIDPKEKKSETVKDKFDDTYSGKTEVDIRKKGGYEYDPKKDKDSKRKERRTYKKKQKKDNEKMIVTPEGEEEAFNRAEEAYNKQREEEESSALELRKQSVFKNAIKGGKIQKELIKQGFDPYK